MTIEIINDISVSLQKGNAKELKRLVEEAMEHEIGPKKILEEGLLSGMSAVGNKFKNNEIFIPEVLVAARAMEIGMKILEPFFIETGAEKIGKAVIGTVKGDIHDIGKNLVIMMLKGIGFEVIDLGTDVSTETFVEIAEENEADIILMSALLTTTRLEMKKVIKLLNERGVRGKYKVFVGGAPVNDEFAKRIQADYYMPDAYSTAQKAREIILCKQLL